MRTGRLEHVHTELSRRGMFKAAALAGAAVATGAAPAIAQTPRRAIRFSRAVDLTHTFSPEFPTFFGVPGIALKRLREFAQWLQHE